MGELFNGCRVPVSEDEKVLEVDGADGCTMMRTCLLRPLNCTVKNG